MGRHLSIRRSAVLAVALIAVYPVVRLWAWNIEDRIPWTDVLPVLWRSLAVAFAVYLIARAAFKDRTRAVFTVVLLVLLVCNFGGAADALSATDGRREDALLLIWAAIAVAGVLVIRRLPLTPRALGGVNLIIGGLVVWNMVLLVVGGAFNPAPIPTATLSDVDGLRAPAYPRDVYYLVFDRYAGSRTLRDLYGFDDGPFLDSLRTKGFIVLEHALANYPQTAHSLASSLSMNHLLDLANVVGVDSSDRWPIYESARDSSVVRAFRGMGYTNVHIGSFWAPTATDPGADVNLVYGTRTEFGGAFLHASILPPVMERLGVPGFDDRERENYDRILFQQRAILDVAADSRPTFTFAHFTLPHPPYVFDASGGFRPTIGSSSPSEAYLDQVRYTHDVIDRLTADLLAGPDEADPIIVIQSDEGPHPPGKESTFDVLDWRWAEQSDSELERKLAILDAMYLPGLTGSDVPLNLTPVNTFRLIFDEYFEGRFPMLPDRTYVFEDYQHPYRFIEVTDRLRQPSGR